MKKLFLFMLTLLLVLNCKAQFWGGFMQGMSIGVQNIVRQQQIQQQQEEQRRQQEARQRELEAQRERERLENEIHEYSETESNGFKWIKFRKGTSFDYYGAKDKNGNEIIPLSRHYESICFFDEENTIGYFKVEKNGKNGACDVTGKEIVPCSYESLIYSGGVFVYKDSSGDWHELDIALDSEGKGCKPDPERKVYKMKKTEDDGYIWYLASDGNKKGSDINGARSIDGKTIVPCNYKEVRYLNGYFITQVNDAAFDNLFNNNGICILPYTRQYNVIEIHADEGWAKVSRETPKGKLAGVIDLRTSKEIVPMRSFCSIRYNKSSKRFETKVSSQNVWIKTTHGLDVDGVSVTNRSNTSIGNQTTASANATNSLSSQNTQTIIVEHQRQPQPVQVWQQCPGCYGSGQCPMVSCGGSGWYFRGDNRVACSRCHGSGKCTTCAGQGGHYVVQYQ